MVCALCFATFACQLLDLWEKQTRSDIFNLPPSLRRSLEGFEERRHYASQTEHPSNNAYSAHRSRGAVAPELCYPVQTMVRGLGHRRTLPRSGPATISDISLDFPYYDAGGE